MSPNFSLRTVLVIMTAAALLIGLKVWLFGLNRYFDPNELYLKIAYQIQIWRDLPLLVVWAVGLEWVARHVKAGTPGSVLLITSLSVNLFWTLFGQIVTYGVLGDLLPRNLYVDFVSTITLMLDTAVQVTVWTMALVAFFRLYESNRENAAPPLTPFD